MNKTNQNLFVLAFVVLIAVSCGIAGATTVVFDGASNSDIPENYGSNIAADGLGFVTTDGTGATPGIGLTWFPAADNVWEFHNSGNFNVGPLSPTVAQMDVDLSQHTVPAARSDDYLLACGWRWRRHQFA